MRDSEILRKWLNSVKKLNESINKNDEFTVKIYKPNTQEWDYIKNEKNNIWNFLNDGYKAAGYERFCGCDNQRSLFRNANLIKIAYYNNEWVVISVYTGYVSGYKNVGITATINPELRNIGIAAVHDIIKNDIGNFKSFFWSECSGAVENLYEKYNGIKIPNEYVHTILQRMVTLDSDGFHYEREVKGDMQRKIIYGFNNKEVYEQVLKEHNEYIKKSIDLILSNLLNEDITPKPLGKLSKIECAIAVINFFVDQRWEGECYDFSQESLNLLKTYVNFLKQCVEKNLVNDKLLDITNLAIENGEDILETSSVIKVNVF